MKDETKQTHVDLPDWAKTAIEVARSEIFEYANKQGIAIDIEIENHHKRYWTKSRSLNKTEQLIAEALNLVSASAIVLTYPSGMNVWRTPETLKAPPTENQLFLLFFSRA